MNNSYWLRDWSESGYSMTSVEDALSRSNLLIDAYDTRTLYKWLDKYKLGDYCQTKTGRLPLELPSVNLTKKIIKDIERWGFHYDKTRNYYVVEWSVKPPKALS